MAVIGKFILENLTTGMYQNSTVIYREYIQNACDAIDKAVEGRILEQRNAGLIDIFIDPDERYVCVDDNGTGIKASDFVTTLGDIANSDKTRGEDKGFRGIGRLCGLAYCETLRFTTSYSGEKVKSIMTCDAATIRRMIYEKEKYTVDQILDRTIAFSTEPEEKSEHYFRVEMVNISKSNSSLLDPKMVKEYLSFVAPAPYNNTFFLKKKIQQFAQDNGFPIDEYVIKVNGLQIFKDYTTKLKAKNSANNEIKNYDDVTDLEFHVFKNADDKVICWMWFGICRFDIQIPECNAMRGLRVRTGNIQIGNDNVVQMLFKEHRGNYYYIGEIFTVDTDLTPNSQRDYFNENNARNVFENSLREYFYSTLHHLYYDANRVKKAYQKQADYQSKAEEFHKKESENGFIDAEEKAEAAKEVATAKENAEKAASTIAKAQEQTVDPITHKVFEKIKSQYAPAPISPTPKPVEEPAKPSGKGNDYITQGLSKLNNRERKIVSRIFRIILDNLDDKDSAKRIIDTIKEDLR